MDTAKYILYADDDVDDRDVFSDGFASFPEYTLLTFDTGIDMLAFIDLKATSLDVHLIISDINMPLMNGIETLRCLKTNVRSKNITTFLYSTTVNAIDKLVADSMGAKMFTKPSSYQGVVEVIKSMLYQSHEPSV